MLGRLLVWVVLILLVLQTTGCDEFLSELGADKTVWYVSTTGDDANPCHTAKRPCRNIATALERAALKDKINIADGSYYEKLTITKDVSLIGASMDNTIIDAQIVGGSVISIDGAATPTATSILLSNLTITGGAAG
jgi:hypothetical protein